MVSINFEGAKQFYAKQPDKTAAQAAFDTLVNGTGAGNDFIGWVDLPVNYDKEEFAQLPFSYPVGTAVIHTRRQSQRYTHQKQ